FLLLIFFMITAAFALQKALEVPPMDDEEAAASQSVEELEEDSIVVRVDEDNVFWVSSPTFDEQRAPSVQEMRSKVRKAREGAGGSLGKGPTKMLVQAHEECLYEFVIAAMDAGADVSMPEVRFMIYEDGDI
ncbi:MAG: biopolymer transporter ExbD, partial [Planctomycetales bacterium]|nr:biopolymer transporter ExbD [Planctomycetales bacterium]